MADLIQADTVISSKGCSPYAFGESLAASGVELLVGAPSRDYAYGEDPDAVPPAAFLLRLGAEGWQPTRRLIAGTPRVAEGFARAVLLAPSFAIVGAPGHEGGDAPVYAFDRSGHAVHLRAEVDSPERHAFTGDLYSEYGAALASEGDLLFVGAPLETEWREGQTNPEAGGVVYVFDRRSHEVRPIATLRSTHPGECFGAALAVSGDLLVVGASGSYSNSFIGAAYVYRREAPQRWRLITRIEGECVGEGFGTCVAIDGPRLVVTAPGRAAIGEPIPSGRADLFEIGPDGCVKVGSIRESQGLGVAVALKGERLAIGEPMASAPGKPTQTGRVGLYRWPLTSANATCEGWLGVNDAPPYARIGSSVVLEAGYVATGAPGLGSGDGKGFVAIKHW